MSYHDLQLVVLVLLVFTVPLLLEVYYLKRDLDRLWRHVHGDK